MAITPSLAASSNKLYPLPVMSIRAIRFSIRGLVAAALLSYAVLSAYSQTPQAGKLKILVPQSTSAIPFLLMEREQPLPGVSIRAGTFTSHPQALALLLRGEVDMLLTGTSQGWENRLDGSPIVMVNTGVWGVSSLVGKDAGIRSFADLRGKRIALPFPGSPLDFQTRAILAAEKLDADRDVALSYGAFTQSLPRLLAGQLDAVALPEPQATAMIKERGLLRLVKYADAWAKAAGTPESPQVSLFVTETFSKANVKLISEAAEAWRKAGDRVEADPGGASEMFAAALSTDELVLQEAIRNTLYGVPSFEDNRTRVLEYYAAVLPYFPGSKGGLDAAFFFLP
jgi:ABC-type nitrate/sulfonate/bicarbonate transport system substrate-binding protein